MILFVLTTGQAFFLLNKFLYVSEFTIIVEPISIDGFRLGLITYEAILTIYSALSLVRIKALKCDITHIKAKTKFFTSVSTRDVFIFSMPIVIFAVLALAILFKKIGGVSHLFTSVRPTNVEGATFPLMMLFSLRIPIMYEMWKHNRISIFSVVLGLIACSIYSLAGSRMLIVVFLLPVLLIFFSSFNVRLKLKTLLLTMFGAFVVLIGSQALKEAMSYNMTFMQGVTKTLSLFYAKQVEGMAGIAGLFTYYLEQGINIDYGFSLFSVFFKIIPSALREPFNSYIDYFLKLYFYKNSIVAPGIQNFLVHTGPLAILLFPLFYHVLGAEYSRIGHSNKTQFLKKYAVIVICGHCLNLVRGESVAVLFYLIGDFLFSVSIVAFFSLVSPWLASSGHAQKSDALRA